MTSNPTRFEDYLAALADEPSQDQPVMAFFDLDRTLIAGYSLTALAWQQIFNGQMSLRRFVSLSLMFLRYGLRRIDYNQMLTATIADILGMSEDALYQLGLQAYEKRLVRWMYQEGRQLVQRHKELGHVVVLATSATRYQALPVAQALGIDRIACTQLEIVDGCVAGGVHSCYGIGKLEAARDCARNLDVELDQTYFYSDSPDDLPLLEAVGHPVVVNGRKQIQAVAQARGWPQLRFRQKSQAPVLLE